MANTRGSKTSSTVRISRKEWQEEGAMHVSRARAVAWELGDWLLKGEELEYDRDFVASLAITGFSRSYLYSLRQTASTWKPHERSYQIAWGTHRELARIKDLEVRKELHAKALKEHWSMHDVRNSLRKEGITEVKVEEPKSPSHGYSHTQVKCPECQHVFEIRGNKV